MIMIVNDLMQLKIILIQSDSNFFLLYFDKKLFKVRFLVISSIFIIFYVKQIIFNSDYFYLIINIISNEKIFF